MGIAMVLVLVYHLFCWTYNPLGRLNIGYVGVDIFLFLSGFGLCRSYESNPLKKFYINRFKRIYPIYFIAVCCTYIIVQFPSYNSDRYVWSFSDLMYNLTTVGYYVHMDENRYDWYIASLFALYLLFPLFYYYSKTKYAGLTILFSSVFLFLCFFNVPWWYDCLIGRLPIFLYGIMFAKANKHTCLISLLGLILYIPCRYFSSSFLATSLLVMPAIILSVSVLQYLTPPLKSTLDYLGKYSLEIYCTNSIVYRTLDWFNDTALKIIAYVILQIILALLFVNINKRIQRLINT